MCIYYGEQPGLHYDSGEHIFPAAIGGIQKLPKGYVSDEFNTAISKIEQDFIREGMVSMPRTMLGPGKRGSLSEAKTSKSKIHTIRNTSDASMVALGYTALAKTYEIPQLVVDFTSSKTAFSYSKELHGKDAVAQVSIFKEKCNNPASLRIRTLLDDTLAEKTIIVGIAEGIEENYNCFIVKSPTCAVDINAETLRIIGAGLTINSDAILSKYRPQVHQTMKFHVDHLRVYGKIVFNFLTHCKGKSFVMDATFDPIRNWIACSGENHFAAMDSKNNNPLAAMDFSMPADAHIVFIAAGAMDIHAKVFLYNGFSVDLLLTDNYPGPAFTDAFFCDWANKKEYRLAEFIG